jgi:hypothetical protein
MKISELNDKNITCSSVSASSSKMGRRRIIKTTKINIPLKQTIQETVLHKKLDAR